MISRNATLTSMMSRYGLRWSWLEIGTSYCFSELQEKQRGLSHSQE